MSCTTEKDARQDKLLQPNEELAWRFGAVRADDEPQVVPESLLSFTFCRHLLTPFHVCSLLLLLT